MTTPVPARAHANMSVAERELTFDSLLAEFGALEEVEAPVARSVPADSEVQPAPVADASAPTTPVTGAPRAAQSTWAARSRHLWSRSLEKASPEILKLTGLIAIAALSLTLVFIALSR